MIFGNRFKLDASGQSLIELLVAVFVLALMAAVVVSLAILTSQMLFSSSRHTTGQALLNEHLEFLRSLPYEDVGFVDGGTFTGVVEPEEKREISGTTYSRRTYLSCETGTPAEKCLKRLEVFVHWLEPDGETRSVRAVTLAAPRLALFNCQACPDGTACHAALGICLPGAAPAEGVQTCTPGLLCPADGSLCPADGICRGAEAAYYQPPADAAAGSEGCVPGQLCSNGALCPYSGRCPIQACPTGSCPADQTCFNSYCYDSLWLYDHALSVGGSSSYQCAEQRCVTSLDCPDPCSVADGSLTLIYRCEPGWVPACRAGTGGGAAAASSSAGLSCEPVACPASGQCLNGQRCEEISSNTLCQEDSDCESGELCDTISRRCRAACPADAACTPYWGGAAQGCRPYAVSGVAGGAVEECSVDVVPVAPGALALTLTGPGIDQGLSTIGVVEGDDGETTTLNYHITLSGVPAGGLTGVVQSGLMIRDESGQAVNTVTSDGGAADYDAPVWIEFLPSDPVVGGRVEKDLPVVVQGDTLPENHEEFTVAVRVARSSAGAAVSLAPEKVAVTILNDDVELALAGETPAAEDPDGDTTVDVLITMNGATNGHSSSIYPGYSGSWAGIPAEVTFQTDDDGSGGAQADEDYIPESTVLTLPSGSGEATVPVTLTILQDGEAEGEEYFVVRLSDPTPDALVAVVDDTGQVVIAANK
ncbi:MAG: hypothetical protein COT71_00220 [Candidatus Andersenbacteria bacterium CG10_big_fil_rev_8_21_14_0_10_54_11]|uniref:Calx-beta domain-containing protein n=1 Tax=Candidatus Andersenbacteria bacterium CG10_big_fil_rev_8_21_14_0_10_54_11 TaxID=1974485 RepID=A0A2M6X0J0_9BACT|nr:MAG: hypothetical protein COT71_00220 [Candidatus Andersenbacteria bacterium CG10_big_fil_rev_8_21_14_0_10_54_11]